MTGKLTRLLLVVTVLNFGVWGVVNSVIRGDAVNGKIEHDKYYVGCRDFLSERN